jgi:TolA-binding protein
MLKPRKRITRKKLKEDKLVTFYFEATAWFEKNANYILGAIALIVLLLAGSYFYLKSTAGSEKTASVDLARATRAYESGDYQNAISLLSTTVDNYGGTVSGKIGRFYLANSFFQTKDYENAEKNFKKFYSNFSGDDYFKAAALGGIAACLEQKQKPDEAAQQYEKAYEKYPKSIMAPHFLIRAGRCYALAGNSAKAAQLYDKVLKEFPQAQEKDEAILLKAMAAR